MFRLTVRVILLLASFFFWKYSYTQENSEISIISEVKIIGNKTTKTHIVIRELPFQVGDTIQPKDLNEILERAESNLLNTLLFNFVTAEAVDLDKQNISIYITVEERWYWWPIPIFEIEETNFNTWWKTKDMNRVNYGMFFAKENFRGRKERLIFKFQAGYTEQAAFRYYIPYINKSNTQGLTIGFSYKQNHELNYSTTDNKRDFFKQENSYVKKEISSKIRYEFRPKLYNTHNLEVQHNKVEIADSVSILNNDFLMFGKNSMEYFSLVYSLKRDKRNLKSYATKGYYFDINLIKNGVGVLSDQLTTFDITSTYSKYWQLSNKFYFSSSIKMKTSLKRSPYFLTNGLGYGNNLVRGYEFYVINGQHFGLFKSQLRYALLDKVLKIKPLPFSKFNKIPISFYPGLFFDSGYVSDKEFEKNNFLNNTMLYGGGVSLDIVSYYDMVFRIEYSVNQLEEHGLFLHFVAPI
jgi:Surface antigen variable number repeat/Omp85 superfamily domain